MKEKERKREGKTESERETVWIEFFSINTIRQQSQQHAPTKEFLSCLPFSDVKCFVPSERPSPC